MTQYLTIYLKLDKASVLLFIDWKKTEQQQLEHAVFSMNMNWNRGHIWSWTTNDKSSAAAVRIDLPPWSVAHFKHEILDDFVKSLH